MSVRNKDLRGIKMSKQILHRAAKSGTQGSSREAESNFQSLVVSFLITHRLLNLSESSGLSVSICKKL